MSLNADEHLCEVCGIETTRRCSSCASANLDLWFCTPQHLQLIWPAHKLACGLGKAYPFATRPLQLPELGIALTRLDEDALPFRPGQVTLRKLLTTFAQSADTAEDILVNLAGDVNDTRRFEYKPLMVSLVRSAVSQHLACEESDAPPVTYSSMLDPNDPEYFDELSTMQYTADIVFCVADWLFGYNAMSRDYAVEQWFSLLQHKLFIMSRLGHLSVHPLAPPGMGELYLGAKERLLEWVKSGMGTERPEFVRALEGFKMGHVYCDSARRP
ncbi:hypothetical protein JCM3775_005845 [Rhodotorula graminis]